MDLDKLAQELGGKPVSDLDALAAELGGEVATTPGGYGPGTFGKDVGKLVGAGAVKGIAGAPETVQAAGSAAARETLFKPTEVLNLVADPRRLANKLVGSVGLPPIFETTKEQPLVPAQVTKEQRAAVDQTLARGKIPQLRQLTEYGNKLSEEIEESISPEMKLAMAESQPTGNIIKALETGDFSEVSMGKNPTALGLTGQAVKVFGTSAPQFIVGMVTKTTTLGAAVGFGQAGAEGIDEARNYIKGMSDEELTKKSEYFRNLIALGYSTNQARQMTEDKAADTAAMAQGTVGALGGAFTSKLLQGGFDKTLLGNVKSRLGKVLQGAGIAGAEGAITELAEGVATDLSIDKTVVREIGVDSFANLVLGAIGEAAPGVVRGALAPGEKVKGAKAPEVPPAPVTPVTPPAGAPPAIIPEGGFETEEEAAAPAVTPPAAKAPPTTPPVTPPAPPAAAPEAVSEETTKRIAELNAEFKQIDEAYATAKPAEFAKLNERQGQIKAEIAALQSGAPVTAVTPTPTPTEEVKPKEEIAPKAAEAVAKPEVVEPVTEALQKYIKTKQAGQNTYQSLDLDKEEGQKLLKENGFKLEDGYYVKGNEYVRFDKNFLGGTYFYELSEPKKGSEKIEKLKSLLDNKDKEGTYQFFKDNEMNYLGLRGSKALNPIQRSRLIPYIDEGRDRERQAAEKDAAEREPEEEFDEEGPYEPITEADYPALDAARAKKYGERTDEDKAVLNRAGRDIQKVTEGIKSPRLKSNVAIGGELQYAPFRGGWISGLSYWGGKSGTGQSPSEYGTIYPNKQDAINASIDKMLAYAYDNGDSKTIVWLSTIDPRQENITEAEAKRRINIFRQDQKKEAEKRYAEVEKLKEKWYPILMNYGWDGIGEFLNEKLITTEEQFIADHGEDVLENLKYQGIVSVHFPITTGQGKEVGKDLEDEFLVWADENTVPDSVQKSEEYKAKKKAQFDAEVEEEPEEVKPVIKKPTKEEKAEANKARQAEKKAAAEAKKAAAAKAKGPVDTSAVKDLIPGKIKKFQGYTIYKRQEDPDLWYVQSPDNKALNRIGQGDEVSTNLDTARSKVELYVMEEEEAGKPAVPFKSALEAKVEKITKPLAKKKEEAKEAHVEGKKSEPITSKTIEEAIDKAETKVDAKKIKQAVKNQFDQAIKRARFLTEKDWSEAKALPDVDAYVTISIPGDGKFKVKNNKERLEEVQKRLTAALPLKEGKPKREVSAASVSSAETAFKAMIDEKDMENAIEYAKLQNLDIKQVKLNPTQKAVLDRYLKNPAEFERQQKEQEDYEEASAAALRADQEKRIREKLEADEKREEEARFKAVIDTTIRSTEAQLRRDIADRKISTKDARRMVEAFPNYPEGVVKPYTIRLIEKRAGVEPSFKKLKKNITEDGQKLNHPLIKKLVLDADYEMLDLKNPRTYVDKGGVPHRTFERNGVRMAFTIGEKLFQTKGKENQPPQTGMGDEKDIHFRALLVDPEVRRQGKATTALNLITNIADNDDNQFTLYLEPAELEKNGITKDQLTQLYSKFRFEPTNESGKIMVREPELLDVKVKRISAEMKEKGIESDFSRMARESKELDVALDKLKEKSAKVAENVKKVQDKAIHDRLTDDEKNQIAKVFKQPSYNDKAKQEFVDQVILAINDSIASVKYELRKIIERIKAGVLAMAVVFNPATFQTPDFDVPRFIEETKTVTAQVPKNADMSEISNQAYSITAPAFIKAKQAFFIADKPNGKIHLFDTDGKFLKSSDALYGKQAGDVLSEQIRTMKIEDMKDVDKITPAGVYNLSVSPSPDYTGGYTLRFNDNRGDLGGIAIHAVYTGNAMEKREAKLASKDPKDKKVSFGCINVDTKFFTGNIIPRIKQMENAGVVVIPDAQERLAMFVKPTLENVTVPAKEIKAADRAKMVARETPYYNDFTSNLDESYFDKQIVKSRDDKISDYAQARAKTRRITKEVAKYGSDIPLQKELNKMLEIEQELKDYLDATKPVRNTAEDFMARAAKELADGNISPEVEGFIRNTFEKNPAILEGLRLSVRGRKGEGRDSGNFNPYTRLVTLWKDGSGVDNAKTIRHELTHSLEQMMRPETKKVLVEQWARAFEQAMKKHTDKASKAYFDAVLDFLENPSKESFDKATKVMPSYDYYQYINPSEYWAVNAEAMLGAKLGGAWSRFTNAVKKLLEGLKSFFGMNNKYAVHKAMDEILSGDMNRINKETLVDYLLQGKYKIDYLNNVEETDALLDKHSRPVPPIHPSNPVKDAFMGGYSKSKKTVENVLTEPRLATSNMIGRADRAITQQRNKNIFYGTGLELADRERYGGQVRNGHKQAIASVALVNAIHSGHIATQVMTQGKLIFNQNTQMFQADKSDKSMANVVRAKAKLVEKLGDVRAAKVIQAFFEAKRSRSIINEYLDRTAAYENAKAAGITGEDLAELKKDLRNIEIAMQKVQMTDEAIDDFINLDKKYPELKEMMDNWTSVNQNMIDMMEFSGLISKQRAETLRNIKDYVPWYRVMDDMEDVHSAPGGTRGMTNVAREKKFKAGEVDRDIDDIVDNMIHNVLTLTRNSMRNYAANRIVMEYGTRTEKGKIKVFPSEGTDNDGVRFNIVAAGRRIVVQIKDPLVAEAVIGMENIDIPMFNALAYLANGLRRSITTFPAFQVAQLFMDAPTAALVTGLKNPAAVWSGVFTSFLKNLRKDDPIVAMLRSYGIGGYQSSARTPEKEIQMDIGLIQGSWFSKAMKGLDRFGDASDYAQRRAVYMQTLKETGDELLAIFQANNVIDFQKRGSGGLAQAVTRSVAFMNAYAQSMDVLAKGIAGGGIKGLSRKQAFARMIATGMALSAATIVYCMLVGDDDEYNKLDDQTKMRNIYIPGLDMRLPMHTGASFFFKAVPELLYNKIMKEGTKDEYDKKRLTRALGKAALDSLLGPNITPTGVKPVVEIGLNRNFFTGGQVTPKGMEDLAAFRQYNQNTSELGKIISALTGTEKTRLLNPMEADHLVRGLLGTAGAAVMWGSNMLIGNRADPQAKDNPFYGQFIMPDVARGREDLYYDLKSKTDEAYKTHQDLLKKGRKEEAAEWFKENKDLIRVYGYTSSVESNLKELNGEIRRIGDLPEGKMNSKQKRERINELQQIKMRVLRDVISMRKRAGLDESYF